MIAWFQSILNMIVAGWNAFLGFLGNIPHWLVGLWDWYKTETLSLVFNFFWDSFSKLASISPYNFNVDATTLTHCYAYTNIFLPLDDCVTLAIFLFETWLAVKIFKFSTYLFLLLFRKPSKAPFGS